MMLIDEYFKYQKTHEEKVRTEDHSDDSNWKVLAEVCSSTTWETARLCNMVLTLKNKNEPMSMKNPNMCGMPISSRERYVEILTNNGYTVAIYSQRDDNSQERYPKTW